MNDNVVQLPGTVRREQGPRRFVPPPVVVDWAARRRRGLANLAAMSGDRHKLQAFQDIIKINIIGYIDNYSA